MYNFFAFLDRMKYIRRWSLMRSSRDENVTEHTQQVAVFAHALAVIDREVFGGSPDVEKTVLLALYHESSEVMTGDLPTPIKYFNREIHGAYKQLEERAERKLLAMLGGGQALRLYQVRGGAEGGQQRVQEGEGEHRGRPEGERAPLPRLLYGTLRARILAHAGRDGIAVTLSAQTLRAFSVFTVREL